MASTNLPLADAFPLGFSFFGLMGQLLYTARFRPKTNRKQIGKRRLLIRVFGLQPRRLRPSGSDGVE
jgi:hypothetical protein